MRRSQSRQRGRALGVLRTAAPRIDVTVPARRRPRSRPGVRIHRSRLDPADRLLHERIPVTSPARTLLDLADVVPPRRVREAFEQTQRLGLFDREEAISLIARARGRRGLKVLGELLAEAADDPPELRSELERAFAALIRGAGIPLPATNVVVAGVAVDAYWPARGLVVELDGYGYHRSRAAFERDHEATERLQRAGLEVRRFTHHRVRNDPVAVIETIRHAFSRREARDKLNPCPLQGRR